MHGDQPHHRIILRSLSALGPGEAAIVHVRPQGLHGSLRDFEFHGGPRIQVEIFQHTGLRPSLESRQPLGRLDLDRSDIERLDGLLAVYRGGSPGWSTNINRIQIEWKGSDGRVIATESFAVCAHSIFDSSECLTLRSLALRLSPERACEYPPPPDYVRVWRGVYAPPRKGPISQRRVDPKEDQDLSVLMDLLTVELDLDVRAREAVREAEQHVAVRSGCWCTHHFVLHRLGAKLREWFRQLLTDVDTVEHGTPLEQVKNWLAGPSVVQWMAEGFDISVNELIEHRLERLRWDRLAKRFLEARQLG